MFASIFTANMSFQIKVIRLAIKKAMKYGKSMVGGVAGEQIALVLGEIDATLGYLGLEHWVAMQEFLNAAVRICLNRQVGTAVYHAMNFLL